MGKMSSKNKGIAWEIKGGSRIEKQMVNTEIIISDERFDM